MIVRITARRQITFPAAFLKVIGVKPGDYLELRESPEGYILKRPNRIDFARLAPLRGKLTRMEGSDYWDRLRD